MTRLKKLDFYSFKFFSFSPKFKKKIPRATPCPSASILYRRLFVEYIVFDKTKKSARKSGKHNLYFVCIMYMQYVNIYAKIYR